MRYQATERHNDVPSDPIRLSEGDTVEIIKESDPGGEWPNWVYCRAGAREGWVPKQIISFDGNSSIVGEDYRATELRIEIAEYFVSDRSLNGWAWGYKESEPEEMGWVPLKWLKEVNNDPHGKGL